MNGNRKRGRPKKTWKKQVEEETEKIGLKKVERRSLSNRRRNEVSPAICAKEIIPDKN